MLPINILSGLLGGGTQPAHTFQYKQKLTSFNFPAKTLYPNLNRSVAYIKNEEVSEVIKAKPTTLSVDNNNVPASPAYTDIPVGMQLKITDDTDGWIVAPKVNGEMPKVTIVWRIA